MFRCRHRTKIFRSLFQRGVRSLVACRWWLSPARRSLWPLLGVGLASAVYWYYGELHGVGDLRAYVLVQFLPVVLIVLLLIFGQNVFNAASGYIWLLASYVLAKAREHFDTPIFQITHGVMAALGLYALLRCMTARRLRHG